MNALQRRYGTWLALGALMLAIVMITACAKDTQGVLPPSTGQGDSGQQNADQNNAADNNTGENAGGTSDDESDGIADEAANPAKGNNGSGTDTENNGSNQETVPVKNESNGADEVDFSDAQSVAVLVNKEYALPEDHKPSDLVYPDVRFTFSEKIEKRMMRSEAAGALEKLFAGAEKDGIYLAGVSAYRSHSTQTSLFNRYVKKDGLEKAKTYSAVPGHSEHETGLAIDVSGSDGKCAAEDCFGDTKEAKWLAEHVTEYGFIIRYPEGMEDITGYKYEPWHLRYVGTEISSDIAERGITLEEYYNAVPVTANP